MSTADSPTLPTPNTANVVVDTDATDDTNDEAEGDGSVPKTKRGRKRLPAHLRRVRIEHDLADADKVLVVGLIER